MCTYIYCVLYCIVLYFCIVFLYCFFYVYLLFLCFCLILEVTYLYCYIYVFLLLCMFCSVYSLSIVPTGTLRLPWLRFFHALPSVVRKKPKYKLVKTGHGPHTSQLIVSFCVLSVCNCVLYYCHRVSTQSQLTNTGCHRRNGPNFGRVFLMLNYTDITQNTYVPSWTVIHIMAK